MNYYICNMTQKKHSKDTSIYYDIRRLIEKYPSALWYFVVGGRATGKTYSSLDYALEEDLRFTFIKRTFEDAKNMCLSMPRENGEKDNRESSSPFEPLNRDKGCNIRAFKGVGDFGYFYDCNELNYPKGEALGAIVALSKVADAKGYDLSKFNELIIYDEFIPQQYTRGTLWNGIQTLDLIQTVCRDSLLDPDCKLKILCLANATEANNPLFSELRLVDVVENMQDKGIEFYYDEMRHIVIHCVPDNSAFMEQMKKSKFAQSIEGTDYYRMSMCNEFAYNDFSLIDADYKIAGMKPIFKVKFKNETWTYLDGGKNHNYFTKRKIAAGKDCRIYDLKKESDQGSFREYLLGNLYLQIISGAILFETYEIYSTILEFMSKFPKSKQN